MIKLPSRAYILKTCIFLSVLYFIFLHPISSFIGGILYLLGGQFIPSVVNLLVTYFIVSLFNIRLVYKYFLFILVSFILGMNTNLLYLHDVKPTNVEITVFHPLLSPVALNDLRQKNHDVLSKNVINLMWDKHEIDVYKHPLYIPTLSANEGCMCSYFVAPTYLYVNSIPMMDNDRSDHFYTIFAPGKLLLTSTNYSKNADYILHISKQNIAFNKTKLIIDIKDKYDGRATMSGIYPQRVMINDIKGHELDDDPQFWKKAVDSFFHDNFWNTYVVKRIETKTESLFNALSADDMKKLFHS